MTSLEAMLVDPANPPRVSSPPPASENPPSPGLGSALVRFWPVVVAITVAAALLAWMLAAAQPRRYRASAIGAVSPLTEQLSPSDIIRGVDSLERRVVVASIAALAGVPGTKRLSGAGDDYTITAAGKKQLGEEVASFERMAEAIRRVLKHA